MWAYVDQPNKKDVITRSLAHHVRSQDVCGTALAGRPSPSPETPAGDELVAVSVTVDWADASALRIVCRSGIRNQQVIGSSPIAGSKNF
jgi:hypothetical protein